jgi:phosphoribosylformylglycinamidine (FGAM) synthase-like enzyme
MMGVIDDVDNLMSPEFKESGHQIYMLGTPYNDFASSEYLRLIHHVQESSVPKFELDEEYHNLYNLKVIIRKKLIQSAHDISEGGLMTALLEAALPHNLGFDIETDSNFRKDAYLFGESQGRIIVTVTPDNEDELVNYLNSHNVSFSKLGEVVGRRVIVDNQDFGLLKDWKSIHEQTLSEKLDK